MAMWKCAGPRCPCRARARPPAARRLARRSAARRAQLVEPSAEMCSMPPSSLVSMRSVLLQALDMLICIAKQPYSRSSARMRAPCGTQPNSCKELLSRVREVQLRV
jgi:hypothetical protein